LHADPQHEAEFMRRPKRPQAPPNPTLLRNLNHAPPVTRREFLGRGMLTTGATVIGAGSLFSLFANPRKAYAMLAPDIATLVTTPCNITAGAGKVPFICFDLAGGGNIAGSNALVGGPGGQLDFLTTAGYSKLGLPGNMIPNSSAGAGNNISTALGLAMHGDSAYLRGIQQRAATTTVGNVNGAVIPAVSQTDTDLNPHNPMYGIHSAGAAGDLLVLIGTESTVSGGNSMAPSYMINSTVMPTKVSQPSDVTGLVNTGALVGLLDQADAVSTLESVERISAMKLGQVSTNIPSQDTAIKNIVQCSYVKAADLVDRYGNATQTLDPSQDSNIVGSGGIFSAAEFQDPDFMATAAVMKMVINGYAGAGTIEMGGFDYHTGDRATGEQRDFKAGQCIGACLEYAARVGVPLMIYVFSDGSLVSSGMVDDSVNGRGKGVWTADNSVTAASLMLVYDPRQKPSALTNQIGYYNSDGSVNTTSSAAANAVNLLAETVVLNYMALHGQAGAFQALQWASGLNTGLGAASTYDSLIAFGQLASVVNGQIV
jgi:hypothetical protein